MYRYNLRGPRMAKGSKSAGKTTCVLPMIFAAALAMFLLYQWLLWNQRHKREGFKAKGNPKGQGKIQPRQVAKAIQPRKQSMWNPKIKPNVVVRRKQP